MKNKKHVILANIVLLYMLSSCISEFEATGVEDMSGLLVVEGIIVEEGAKITLSRTVKLDEILSKNYLFEGVNYASIHIIDEAYNVVAVAEQYDTGKYIVNEKFSFVPGMKYALDIEVYWKHYQSAFVEPVYTPEIDSVNWTFNDDNSIDIMVSTHDPENETLNCLWNFEENWEIRSRFQTMLRYDITTATVIPQSLYGDNRYYCWATSSSQSLLLATSEKYRDAVIKDHKIHTLQPGNSRYSYLYSITVNQYRLNRDASLYFNNLQRNIDDSGSLFAPQPSEITGNIQCLSDPDETVIGYIFASKPVTSRLFIQMAEQNLNYFEDRTECDTERMFLDPRDAYYAGYSIFGANDDGRYSYISARCVDCTQRQGAGYPSPTKIKPDFWPNDHQ